MGHLVVRTRLLSFVAIVVQAISVGAQSPHQDERLFPITKNGRDGYIDRSGKIRIEPQFASAGRFSEGLAAVSVEPDFKEGYINSTGEWVIEPRFGGAGEFSEGLATVHLEVNLMSPTVVIDRTGQVILQETSLQRAGGRFFEGLKAVGDGAGKWGYIDRTGKIVIEPRFDQPGDFCDGIARVEINEQAQYIDKTGAVAFTLPYEYSGDLREGLIGVCITRKKCGYADRSRALVIAPRFHQVENFSEGLAAVEVNGRWGVIDKTGRFVVKPRFKSLRRGESPLEEFSGGLTRVTVPWQAGELAKTGYIDRTGKYVWEPTD